MGPLNQLPKSADLITATTPALVVEKSIADPLEKPTTTLALRKTKTLNTLLIRSDSSAAHDIFYGFIKAHLNSNTEFFSLISEFKLNEYSRRHKLKSSSNFTQRDRYEIDKLSAGIYVYHENNPRSIEEKNEDVHYYHQLRTKITGDLPDQALAKINQKLQNEAQIYLSCQSLIAPTLSLASGLSLQEILPLQNRLRFSGSDQAASWFNARQLLSLAGKILYLDKHASLTPNEFLSVYVDLIYQQAAEFSDVQLPSQFRAWLLKSSTFKIWTEKVAELYVESGTLERAENLT